MRVNYLGTVHSVQTALPGMLERGRGHIVLVASTLAVLGFAGEAAGRVGAAMGAVCRALVQGPGSGVPLRSRVLSRPALSS